MTRERSIRSAVAGLLTPQPVAPGGRVHRDWEARMRGTPLDALRYTRFVALMKRTLPIAAGVILAAVLIYSFIPRQSERIQMTWQDMGRIDNDLAMIKPRLTGADNKGEPFVITAESAIQDRHNLHRARLNTVEADISLQQDRWLTATATKGVFDMDAGTLALTNGISVYSDSGYELHTVLGDIDLKRGIIRGPVEVTGQGPLGNFRADRFVYVRGTNLLTLSGHVHTTIYQQHSTGKASGAAAGSKK